MTARDSRKESEGGEGKVHVSDQTARGMGGGG